MKTNSTDTLKILRIIARAMSAIFVGFALIMFIGESIESAKKATQEPMTLYSILQLTLMGIGLLGLALAWKWEMAGGIISLLAFITVFIVNQDALLLTMFIFPANAILFIVAALLSRVSEKNLVH